MKLRAASLLVLTGCYHNAMMMGVTPGGSQDIQLARDLIEDGQIPDQEHYTAEGLFSEHDLPLDGAACAELICPRTATTVHAPIDGSDPMMMVQLGFGSSISAEDFSRPDLDVVAVVDISGSMTDNLDVVSEALNSMVAQLDADDHMSLVTFGSRARVVQKRIAMDRDGREEMQAAIQTLSIAGSTDVESGMQVGYRQLDTSTDQLHRMMVFTDAQPNTGVTEQSAFVEMVREAAADDIGTTIFGTGWDLGSELADSISRVRGGSYHFLSEDTVERLFVEEFDFNVTPVAYDLEVEMLTVEGASLVDVYGAPVDSGAVRLGASTLFLSTRSGGMAATLEIPVEEVPMSLGFMGVRYTPVGSDTPVHQQVSARWEGGTFIGEADGLGVYKISGLVDEFDALTTASLFCDGEVSQDDALAAIAVAADRLAEKAELLADEPLLDETMLMLTLHENVSAGLDRCSLADTYIY